MSLVLQILAAAQAFEKSGQQLFRPHGLSLAQFNVLNLLSDQPAGMRASDLATALVVDPSNVTGLLKRMKVEGLIKALENEADRRQHIVGLTAKGQRLWSAAHQDYRRRLDAIEAGVRSGDRKTVEAVLKLMQTALRARFVLIVFAAGWLAALSGCLHPPGSSLTRRGDEIVVAGQFFHTGTRVVTWMEPGGYDAYRVERRFAPLQDSDWDTTKAQVKSVDTPNRYGLRHRDLSPEEVERVRGGGWDLPTLQRIVDQFVIHYDVAGTSKFCFATLQDQRDLSVHFMLDLDGTIYQTLDLKERARHATIANDRSIGIEIANVGAYPAGDTKVLDEWYAKDATGRPFIKVPERLGDPSIRTPNFVGRPSRPEPVRGVVQNIDLVQYDFTPQQYAALIKLTATLCKVFPKIKCDYPRGPDGRVIPHKLTADEFKAYEGVLGHYHIQTNKTDPGPAFQWVKVIDGARRLLQP